MKTQRLSGNQSDFTTQLQQECNNNKNKTKTRTTTATITTTMKNSQMIDKSNT